MTLPGELQHETLHELVELEVIEFYRIEADHTAIVLVEPLQCRICGAEHWWFINRDGCTRCVECDARHTAQDLRRDAGQLTKYFVSAK